MIGTCKYDDEAPYFLLDEVVVLFLLLAAAAAAAVLPPVLFLLLLLLLDVAPAVQVVLVEVAFRPVDSRDVHLRVDLGVVQQVLARSVVWDGILGTLELPIYCVWMEEKRCTALVQQLVVSLDAHHSSYFPFFDPWQGLNFSGPNWVVEQASVLMGLARRAPQLKTGYILFS